MLSEKKILNETKNHNPPTPLQVKWSVPKESNVIVFAFARPSVIISAAISMESNYVNPNCREDWLKSCFESGIIVVSNILETVGVTVMPL